MKNFRKSILFASSILFTQLALAEQPSYSFVEIEGVDIDGARGGGLNLSVELNEQFHAFGSFGRLNSDSGFIDVDAWDVGLGYRGEISDTTSFHVEAGYASAEASNRFFSVDEDGAAVAAGLRSNISESVELNGEIQYVNLNQSATSVELGLVYYVTEVVGLSADVSRDNDSNTGYSLGIRFNF